MKLQNFLGVNLLVRFKNPLFWFQLAMAVLMPMLTYFGATWNEMTSWGALGKMILSALSNPVVVVATIVSVWNTLTDPTSAGLTDSEEILGKSSLADKEVK